MARKRMIDPTIWEDENFGRLSPRAKILFIGLFSNSDDEGRIRANDSYIRSTIFMYDDISLTTVRQLVDEVAQTMKSILFYEVFENKFIQLQKWEDYQKQREDRIQKSLLPSPKQANVRQVTDICQTVDSISPLKLSKVKLSKVKLSKEKVAQLTLLEEELLSIAEKYQVPIAFVLSKQDDVNNWIEENPNKAKGRNLRATLMRWVKKDAMERRDNAKTGSKIAYVGDTL